MITDSEYHTLQKHFNLFLTNRETRVGGRKEGKQSSKCSVNCSDCTLERHDTTEVLDISKYTMYHEDKWNHIDLFPVASITESLRACVHVHTKHLTPLWKDTQTTQSSRSAWQRLQKLRCTVGLSLVCQLRPNEALRLLQSLGTPTNGEGWD